MSPQDAAERKRKERERRAKEGLERFEAYIHPDDRAELQRKVESLAKRRNAK